MGSGGGTGGTPFWGELQAVGVPGVLSTGMGTWLGRTWPGSDLPPVVSVRGWTGPDPKERGAMLSPALIAELGCLAHPKMPGQELLCPPPCRSRAGNPQGELGTAGGDRKSVV